MAEIRSRPTHSTSLSGIVFILHKSLKMRKLSFLNINCSYYTKLYIVIYVKLFLYWLTVLSSCESCVNVLPARSTTRLSAPRYLNMHATMANTCRSNFILPFFSLVNTLFSTMKQAPGGLNLLVYSRNVGSIFGITKVWLRGNVDSTV
jgi:hypothetical protein